MSTLRKPDQWTGTTPHAAPPPPPPPPPFAPQPYPGVPASSIPIKNYLTESILVTVLCCLPLGIVAITYATKVNNCLAIGDIEGAKKAAEQAKTWSLWGLISAIIFNVAMIILFFLVAAASL